MFPFQLTIIGSLAAYPTADKGTTAQILNIRERYYLIDCGEGTQARLRKFGIKTSKIDHIFISHVHGDHTLGLMGLIGSFGLLGRKNPLHLHCPKGVRELITAFIEHTNVRRIEYPLHFHEHQSDLPAVIWEDETVRVTTIPLLHDAPTTGFLFEEKPLPRKMRKAQIEAFNIPFSSIKAIKAGADFQLPSGETIANTALTLPPPAPRRFAFCSDTAYHEPILAQIEGVDLLYHEATFGAEKLEELKERQIHSTAAQAATIAQKAGAKRLIIGHFSPRYKDLSPLLAEARAVFSNTELAIDGQVFDVPLSSENGSEDGTFE